MNHATYSQRGRVLLSKSKNNIDEYITSSLTKVTCYIIPIVICNKQREVA